MTSRFWEAVDAYLAKAARLDSARALVAATIAHFPAEQATRDPSADAIFPGSGGDEQLIDAIVEAPGWRVTWSEATYHWTAVDPRGVRIHYVEGDLYIQS